MDWPQLLRDLKARGWTQAQIAERVGVKQSVISDLSNKVISMPKFNVGSAIVALHSSGELASKEAA